MTVYQQKLHNWNIDVTDCAASGHFVGLLHLFQRSATSLATQTLSLCRLSKCIHETHLWSSLPRYSRLDQCMTEEWIVRVQGREYGPANIETLREWKAEGRLLPGNEARRADVDLWTTAAEIPGLFTVPPVVPSAESLPRQTPIPVARRTFAEILTETIQIYRKGFFQFLGLTLLVLLPSICSQLTTAFVKPPQSSNVDMLSVLAA